MLHFYTLGKIQGQLTSGFPVDAEIPWCPYSWMCSTKISKITQKNRQNTLKDFPGQKVVLSEQLLKHGILKFAENRKETFFCKSINTRHIFQNCVSACLRVYLFSCQTLMPLISLVSHLRLGWPMKTNNKGSKSVKVSARNQWF